MSNIARMALPYQNAHFWFAREGAEIDGATVSKLIKPDVDPTDNWASIGCTTESQAFVNVKDRGDRECLTENNRYELTEDKSVQTGGWLISAVHTNEIVRQLSYGLAAQPVNGVEQVPFQPGADVKVWGWLKVKILSEADVELDGQDLWGYFTLEEIPKSQPNSQQVRLKFTTQHSVYNTHLTIA